MPGSVLLVEDHPLLIEGLRALLNHAGFTEILTAASVNEAAALMADAPPLALAVDDVAGRLLVAR